MASYIVDPAVTGRGNFWFTLLEVNLNSNSPVLNLGLAPCPANLDSGISNVPSIAPTPSVIRGDALVGVASVVKFVDAGVINALTSTPSKNGYILVLGLKALPLNVIVFALNQGIIALDITLVPCDSSSICSTTSVLSPVLLRSVLVV